MKEQRLDKGAQKGSICIGKTHCSLIGTWEVIGE